jgi:alkylation response protein AidB-like acyl-CoA dehydrogenase
MNLNLSDEQVFLQEAARNALGRVNTVEAAREALDGGELPDLWPTAKEAGWSGLLVAEEHGGAGLGAFDAMLVMAECGRRIAPVPLLGHLPATALLGAARADGDLLRRLGAGDARAAYLPVRPPAGNHQGWTVEPDRGSERTPAPSLDGGKLSGTFHWVPDAPGADVFAGVALDGDKPVAVLVEGAQVEDVTRYDMTRSLGHVKLDGATVTVLDAPEDALAGAWYLAQALLAAEAQGTVEECLDRSVEYAKERFTFGRPIGSYQAVKHSLVEVLRRLENLRSLVIYAGYAGSEQPAEFPIAASAARVAGGKALDYATRELISVHGGIGATWEHDAPLFFRRAQVSRRLLGGDGDAADRVADQFLATA